MMMVMVTIKKMTMASAYVVLRSNMNGVMVVTMAYMRVVGVVAMARHQNLKIEILLNARCPNLSF
jgi:hypothetical protein